MLYTIDIRLKSAIILLKCPPIFVRYLSVIDMKSCVKKRQNAKSGIGEKACVFNGLWQEVKRRDN